VPLQVGKEPARPCIPDPADPVVAGSDDRGHLNAGLFFVCFVRNPQTQFVPMQRLLAANDAMSDYITHTGSAVFACPPGLREGEYWGQRLLEDTV